MIGEFPRQRFKRSCNLLKMLCGVKFTDSWLDADNSDNVTACMYKGSFIESIEFIYGFVPEVFKEYCKQFNLVVYSKNGISVGHLDVIDALYNKGILDIETNNLLKKLFSTRGEIIHITFLTKEQYYVKLSWMVKQIQLIDLRVLYTLVNKLCSKINSSYEKGVSNTLVVEKRRESFRPSNSNWRS